MAEICLSILVLTLAEAVAGVLVPDICELWLLVFEVVLLSVFTGHTSPPLTDKTGVETPLHAVKLGC